MWNPLADEDKEPEPAPFSFYSDPLAAYAPGGVKGIKHSTASGARGLAHGPPPPRPSPGILTPLRPQWRPAAHPSGPPPFATPPPSGAPQHHNYHQPPQLQQLGGWPQQPPVPAYTPPPHHPSQMQASYTAAPTPWTAPPAPGYGSSIPRGHLNHQNWHLPQQQQQQGRGWGRGGGLGGRGGGRRPAFDEMGAVPKMARMAGPEDSEGGAFHVSSGQAQSRAGLGMGGRGGGIANASNIGNDLSMGRGGRGGGRDFGGPGGGAGGSDPMARYYKPTFSKDPWSGLLQQQGPATKMLQVQQQQQRTSAAPCPALPNGSEEASKAQQPKKQTLSQILAKVGTKAGDDIKVSSEGVGPAREQGGAVGGGLSLAELMESSLEEVRGMGDAGDDSKFADAEKYRDEGAMDRPWH